MMPRFHDPRMPRNDGPTPRMGREVINTPLDAVELCRRGQRLIEDDGNRGLTEIGRRVVEDIELARLRDATGQDTRVLAESAEKVVADIERMRRILRRTKAWTDAEMDTASRAIGLRAELAASDKAQESPKPKRKWKQDGLLLSPRQAAKLTGLGVNYTYAKLQSGEMPSIKSGKRFFIPKAALMKWMENPAGAACEKAPESRQEPRHEAAAPEQAAKPETAQERYFRECRDAGNKARRDLGLPELPENYIHPEWSDRPRREQRRAEIEAYNKALKIPPALGGNWWHEQDAYAYNFHEPPSPYQTWEEYREKDPYYNGARASRNVTSSPEPGTDTPKKEPVSTAPAQTTRVSARRFPAKRTRVKKDLRWNTSTYIKPRYLKDHDSPKEPTAAEIATNTALPDGPGTTMAEFGPEKLRELITRGRRTAALTRESRRQRNMLDLAHSFCNRMIEQACPSQDFSDMVPMPVNKYDFGHPTYYDPEEDNE